MKHDHQGRRTVFGAMLLALAAFPTGTTEATSSTPAACASPTALCLSNGRFALEAVWKTSDGSEGVGHPVPLVSESGYFWFFDPNNVEIAVKTLNGCGINSRFWLFAAGLTDVEVTLTVTDTVSGQIRTYTNPLGQAFQPITDTDAFPTCSDADAALSIHSPEEPPEQFFVAPPSSHSLAARSLDVGCVPSGTTLCVKGRFQIEATWHTASGASGPGYAVPLTSEAGYFWFFQPSNVELITKNLDACSIGSGQWFFAAGLTDVGVELTVTDTFTGESKVYSNPLGKPFVPVLDTAAFSFCPPPTPTPTPIVDPEPKTYDVRIETQNEERYCCLRDPFLFGGRCLKFCTRSTPCASPTIVPNEIRIHVGDTVRWIANDCGHRLFDLRYHSWEAYVAPYSTYRRAFTFPGTYLYACLEHAEEGSIIVER